MHLSHITLVVNPRPCRKQKIKKNKKMKTTTKQTKRIHSFQTSGPEPNSHSTPGKDSRQYREKKGWKMLMYTRAHIPFFKAWPCKTFPHQSLLPSVLCNCQFALKQQKAADFQSLFCNKPELLANDLSPLEIRLGVLSFIVKYYF